MSDAELRKIAQEEITKQIRENIDSVLIFKYVSELEEKVKKQDKMIDLMAQELIDIPIKVILGKASFEYITKEDMIEHFRKKVENDER